MSDLLIGIDLGTTSTKAAVFDQSGHQIAEAVLPTPLNWHGPDACDQDPQDFYAGTISAVRGCLDQKGVEPSRVVGLGVAGQMAGVMGVDANFCPSMPYDSWLDLRCAADVSEIEATVGGALISTTGCPPMVNHAPKMRWWKREQPGAYDNTAKFVMPGGYVAGRLAGLKADDAFIDHTYLHFTGVADSEHSRWSDDLTREIGIDKEKLPRIVEPTLAIGVLSAEASAATGLPQGVPIAAGLGDTAAGALGAGVVYPDQLLDVAGTAAVFAGSTNDFRPDVKNHTLLLMHGAIDGQWISLAYLSGGNLITWFQESVASHNAEPASEMDFDQLTEAVETIQAGADGLLFLPFLDGRILPTNASMRGAWIGLNRHHRHEHMLRAVLESVPYEYSLYLRIFRELHPRVRPSEIRAVGGGARSAVWNRIKASVLGLPYCRVEREEPGCWGAAMTAGKAVGLFEDLAQTATSTTAVAQQFDFDPADHETYTAMTSLYGSAIEGLEATFAQLAPRQTMKSEGEAFA